MIRRRLGRSEAGDSVALRASDVNLVGKCQDIVNTTAVAVQVFGQGADTINGSLAATGVSLSAGKTGHYCETAVGSLYGGTLN